MPRKRGLVPGRHKASPKCPHRLWSPPNLTNGYRWLIRGKVAGPWDWPRLVPRLSGAKPLRHICLHGVHKDSFTCSVYLCPDGPTSRNWEVLSITRLKASLFFVFTCCCFTKKFCGQNLWSRWLRYHRRRETVRSGNVFLHDSTHASKYDVITASACLRCERWRQVIEVYGLSDRVTVFSYVVGLLQMSVYFVDCRTLWCRKKRGFISLLDLLLQLFIWSQWRYRWNVTVIIWLYRTLRFSHVEMFPSTAGGTIGQRSSSVSSLKQRCFMIIKGNVLYKTSALVFIYCYFCM
jgi:hypothetical protein